MLRRFIGYVQNSKLALGHASPKRAFALQKEVAATLSRADDILSPYTKEEREKILGLVNSLKLEEMLSYSITKGRANKLMAWKDLNGSLQTIDDILLVDGFGLKTVDTFYRSLLQKPPDNEEVKKQGRSRINGFLTPALDASRRDSIRSCVSLRIGVSSISWSRLEVPSPEHNMPCKLTHWQHYEICEKKMHINDLVQRCLYADHMIPIADCYIFENPQMAQVITNPGSAEQQNVSVQKAQIIAVLSYAVARRHYFEDSNNNINAIAATAAAATTNEVQQQFTKGQHVYYLRRFLTARLFKHLVGTERVSSEESVLQMMRTEYNIPEEQDFILDDSKSSTNTSNEQIEKSSSSDNSDCSDVSLRSHVKFNNEQRHMFAHAKRYHREFLGQALLLNLAFVRLALLQDSRSIAALSRLSNKDKETNME